MTRKKDSYVLFAVLTLMVTTATGQLQLLINCPGMPPEACQNLLADLITEKCNTDPSFCQGASIEINDHDECSVNIDAPNSHDCDPAFASCVNTDRGRGFHCVCNEGFTDPNADNETLSGLNCMDIDECDPQPGLCAPDHANCTNEPGTYSCACDAGYTGNASVLCSDVDECDNNPCPQLSTCKNTGGSYMCECDSGYTYNTSTNACDNIDECLKTSCTGKYVCKDTVGSFECECPANGTCEEVSCLDATDCSVNTDCFNITNGYTCECKSGYSGDPRNSVCEDINECELGLDICHTRAQCINQNGTYVCKCLDGFTGNGFACEDIDECVGSAAIICGINEECVNSYGNYSCDCVKGYQFGATKVCEDINECIGDNAVFCGVGTCVNNNGSYACECDEGYGGEPCIDINECDDDPCAVNTQCRDSPGSYRCVCDIGYSGDNCTDIDECVGDNAFDCIEGECVNLIGSVACNCTAGYSGLPCENINECEKNPCSTFASCNDTTGSYECKCNEGYSGDGKTCTEWCNCGVNEYCDESSGSCSCLDGFSGSSCTNIDECNTIGTCDANANCTDTIGSFSCVCKEGYSGEGIGPNSCEEWCNCGENEYCDESSGSCFCLDGFSGSPCTNIDECNTTDPCDTNADCTDSIGSYNCVCKEGYSGEGIGLNSCEEWCNCGENEYCNESSGSCPCLDGFSGPPCTNIDECNTTDPCDTNADCTDSIGSYNCVCKEGYSGEGIGPNSCEDVDECKNFDGTFSNICGSFGNCNNTIGSYTCACNEGFSGTPCQSINQCETLSPCNALANCTDEIGRYFCTCKDGYIGTGIGNDSCADVNECETAGHNCNEAFANCVNEVGSFRCECKAEFLDKNPTQPGTVCEGPSCNDTCDENAECVFLGTSLSTSGCQCKEGYTGDGVDSCVSESPSCSDTCHFNAECVFLGTSPETSGCKCKEGYTGDGINSCVKTTGCNETCHINAECNTTTGKCECNLGFFGNGVVSCSFNGCVDTIDEFNCTAAPCVGAICKAYPGATCKNNHCRACFPTFFQGEVVVDCDTPVCNDTCHFNAECVFTESSTEPSGCQCKKGYTGDGINSCDKTPVCNDTCHANAECVFLGTLPETSGCQCKEGYTGDGIVNCVEKFEETCDVCHVLADCEILESHPVQIVCSCKEGYSGDGKEACELIGPSCSDTCHANAECVFLGTSPKTSGCQCKEGYTGDGVGSCVESPVCNDTCHVNAQCVFLETLPKTSGCQCKEGYTGDGVDSCASDSSECPDLSETLKNGVVTFSGLFPGVLVTYSCDSNYVLIGNKTRVCLPTFEWGGVAPTCARCGENVTVANCLVAPCTVTTCASDRSAECRDNYCGGCNAEFYSKGEKIDCNEQNIRCPEITNDTSGICVEECNTTLDCLTGQMCCSTGCGHTCLNDPETTTILPPPPPMITLPPPTDEDEETIGIVPPPPMIPPPFFLEDAEGTVIIPGLPPMFPPPPPFDVEDTQTDQPAPLPMFPPPPPFFVNETEAADPGPPPMFPPPPFMVVEETKAVEPGPPPMFPPPPPFTAEEMGTDNVAPPPPMFIPPPPFFKEKDGSQSAPPPALIPPPFPFFLLARERRDVVPPMPMMPPPPPYTVSKLGKRIPPMPPLVPPPPSYKEEANKTKIAPPPPPMIIPPPVVEKKETKLPPPPPSIIPPPPMPKLNETEIMTCPAGYIADNSSCVVTCVDIDECVSATHDCDINTQECNNTEGSFECVCQEGYEDIDGVCTDTTVCGDYNCHEKAECVMSEEGAMKCKCPPGVFGDGVTWCQDFDECSDDGTDSVDGNITWAMLEKGRLLCSENCTEMYNNATTVIQSPTCHLNARCINTFGGFDCKCKNGYIGDGRQCELILSCATTKCPEFSTCDEKDGVPTCGCNDGFMFSPDSKQCLDLDECDLGIAFCRTEEKCNNTVGNYECICKDGYERANPGDNCQLIDECDTTPCIPKSVCKMTVDGAICECEEDYIKVDGECKRAFPCAINLCHDDATCAFVTTTTTTICTCNQGFTGNGRDCTPLTGCDANPCHADANCNDTTGEAVCTCARGYIGDGIDTCDFDNCLSGPCPQNSECKNLDDTYSCTCFEGFSGENCVAINSCESTTCPESSTCIVEDDLPVCKCFEGFTGEKCVAINPCENATCPESSTCIVEENFAVCKCLEGFTGENCVAINPCETATCPESSTCIVEENLAVCKCLEGFTGENCVAINPCESATCPESSTCIVEDDLPVCKCLEGFTGENCVAINPCESANCPEFSACVVEEDLAVCKCEAGLVLDPDVPQCIDINECELNPTICESNEFCNNTHQGFECLCNVGYERVNVGESCQLIDNCFEAECVPNSVCKNEIGGFTCECNEGYMKIEGDCQKTLPCSENMCDKDATCAFVDKIFCTCNDGFTGDGFNCSKITGCESSPCNANAVCDDSSGSVTCTCQERYTGNGFDCVSDQCFENSCPVNSFCQNNVVDHTCICDTGFIGSECTPETPCNPNPCDTNSDSCTINGDNFICNCKSGFENNGSRCDDINECETGDFECKPNSECRNIDGGFTCDCVDKYILVEGDCVRAFSCAINLCDDDATCFFAGETICVCNEGFTGSGRDGDCTQIKACDSNPCHANADCVDLPGTFSCTCREGFIGDECAVDNCVDNTCPLNSVCENLVDSYNCNCNEGFTGPDCVEITPCFPDPCGSNSNSCNINGENYICDCELGYFFNNEGCQNIDECTTLPEPCLPTFECVDSVGAYSCVCGDGFREQDGVCTDIDECFEEIDLCGDSNCINDDGGYECKCPCGYFDAGPEVVLRGTDCALNQCLMNTECDHICAPERDSFTCSCYEGFILQEDQRTCLPESPCDDAICTNGICYELDFSQQCQCVDGFTPDLTDPRLCLPLTTCKSNVCEHNCNLIDGNEVCSCNPGYVVSDDLPTCCVPEQCTLTTCNGNGNCTTDLSGSLSCSCDSGFQGDNCQTAISCDHSPCGPGVCTNLEGGGYSCACWYAWYKFTDTCVDINECEESDACLGENQVCVDNDPGFTCECAEGYRPPDDSDDPTTCYPVTLFPYGFLVSDVILNPSGLGQDFLYRSTFRTDVAFQQKLYSRYYVLINGAIVLERGIASETRDYKLGATGEDFQPLPNGNEIDHVLVAPFLGDFDSRVSRSRVFVDKYFWNSVNPEEEEKLQEVSNLLNDYFSLTDFYATEVVIVTWDKLAAKVTFSPDTSDMDDTFQAVIATDGIQSYVMFNYRIGSMDARHGIRLIAEPLVGFTSTDGYAFTQALENRRRPDLSTNIGKTGRFAYQLHNETMTGVSPQTYCMNWYREQPVLLASPVCPSTLLQMLFLVSDYTYLLYQTNSFLRMTEIKMDPYFEPEFIDKLGNFTNELCFRSTEAAADGSGAICCYIFPGSLLLDGYNHNQQIMGGQVVRNLITDPANITTANNFLEQDIEPREICCAYDDLCELYKEKRPSTYAVMETTLNLPTLVNTLGDPTLGTVDGNVYSFSGLGEYTFLTGDDIEVQGRFVQSVDVDGKLTEGTILRAVAAQSTLLGTPKIEFKLALDGDSDIQNMTITVDGSRLTTAEKETLQAGTLTYTGVEIRTIFEQEGVRAYFDNNIIVTGVPGPKILTSTIGIPTSQKNRLKGLYGFYDGNSTNDFQLRDGTELDLSSIQFTLFESPSTTKETRMNDFIPPGTVLEEEVFDFGQSWLIEENASLFTYNGDESWSSMRNTSFIPTFLPDLLEQASDEQLETAREICMVDGAISQTCLRTLLITKDSSAAAEVLAVAEELNQEMQALVNNPPAWNTTITEIEVQVGVPFTIQLLAQDDGVVTYSLDGTIVGATVNSTTGEFKWTPADDTSYSLLFVATDSFGLQTQKGVKIKLCSCQNEGTCNYGQSDATVGDGNNFQVYGCNCEAAWTGANCEADKDECVTNPCDSGNCVDAAAPATGFTCEGVVCPEGQVLFDGECWRVDGCADVTINKCNGTCEVLDNSDIQCGCDTGFQLNEDNVSCDNINECDTMCKAANTNCVDSSGNYSCSCMPGFQGDPTVGCTDINECEVGTHTCDTVSKECKNGFGTFVCNCKSGFSLKDGSCVDDDECELKTDTCNDITQVCKNEAGTFGCECGSAFTLEGSNCNYDCTKDLHTCPTGSSCNPEASRESYTCFCSAGYDYNSTSNACDDIDECLDNDGKGSCEHKCTNTDGFYECSCDSGYSLDSDSISCSDINECDNTATCEQTCTNLPGTHSCTCFDGFDKTADGSCSATAPCTPDNTLDCVNAVCFKNSTDQPNCACNSGFQRINSTDCEDILECDTSGRCGDNTICTELVGSYSCACKQFYVDLSASEDPTVVSCVAVVVLNFVASVATPGINSVSITWSLPVHSDEIRVTIEKSDGSGSLSPETLTTSSKNFTGLEHDTMYNFTFVNVYKGVESIPIVKQFKTDILLLPPTIESIDKALVTSSSISVAYTPPSDGYCDEVKFYYSVTGSNTTATALTATGSPFIVGSLDPMTSYTIEAVCVHSTTESEKTSVVQFTSPNPPLAIREVSDSTLPYGSIAIDWDAPTPAPNSYEVDVPAGFVYTLDSTIATKGVISDITPGTEFTVTVFSLNEGLRSLTGQSLTTIVPVTTTTQTTTVTDVPTTTKAAPITQSTTTTSTAAETTNIVTDPATSTGVDITESVTSLPAVEKTTAVDTTTSTEGTTSSISTTTPALTTTTPLDVADTATSTVPTPDGTTAELTTAVTDTTPIATVPTTTPALNCGSLEVAVGNECRTYLTTTVSVTVTSLVFTEDLNDPTSTVYQQTVVQFTIIFESLLTAVGVEVYQYSFTFSSGSVVADAELNIPDTVEETSEDLNNKINKVLSDKTLPIFNDYNISRITVKNFNECSDATLNTNCHASAQCIDQDPGYECVCSAGYRDRNESIPGTDCEPQCDYEGSSYCLNGGTCETTNVVGDPNCKCTTFYQGKRCAESNSGAIAGVVLGVLGGVLLIVIVVVLILYFKKKRAGHQNLTLDDETRKRYKERNLDDMLA